MCLKLQVQLERRGHKRDPQANKRSVGYEESCFVCQYAPYSYITNTTPPTNCVAEAVSSQQYCSSLPLQNTSYLSTHHKVVCAIYTHIAT